jgi:hypothetical protein
MDLKTLQETPPWDWPEDAGDFLLEILRDRDKGTSAADRLLAAELVGDSPVMNNELAEALMAIAGSGSEPEDLRATAAISLGPVLEQSDLDGFDDPDDLPITEKTFHAIQELLHKLYLDEGNSKELRRRFLEAAVRAPQDWQTSVVRTAYSSGDKDWMLTAVFAMSRVPGFDDQIMDALENADPEIHYEAVNSAGARELEAAWPHIVALIQEPSTPKDLLIAAIEAIGYIRPKDAEEILSDLARSSDEEIADAVSESIAMSQALSGEVDGLEDVDEGGWVN